MAGNFDFTPAIARCLSYPAEPSPDLLDLITTIRARHKQHVEGQRMDRNTITELQAQVAAHTMASAGVALVYGGATRIKGYVFEAPKLQEIRGASMLLDWVNEKRLPRLWGARKPDSYAAHGVIYASGGNILAFAPVARAQRLADAIERMYTSRTLTANSAAITATFGLLELFFGRLNRKTNGELYWIDDFERDWGDATRRAALKDYYYEPREPLVPGEGGLPARFFNRKAFGECVTLLATLFNRRRDERHTASRVVRALPSYHLLPWSAKCDSSDIRPAILQTTVGDEDREMSEPSARKRYVGQLALREEASQREWYTNRFDWQPFERQPYFIESWEVKWTRFLDLDKGRDTPYAKVLGQRLAEVNKDRPGNEIEARPTRDVHEIGAGSGRYIAMIYADGNNVGRLIATQRTPEEYALNSRILSEAAQTAVFSTLAQHLEPTIVTTKDGDEEVVHPFEILAVGGDDLLLIVPGKQALRLAYSIGQTFERQLAQHLFNASLNRPTRAFDRYHGDPAVGEQHPPVIGLSAGVVIAQENTPIFFLRDLVDELLKNAKELARNRADYTQRTHWNLGGAVDFMVMKSITMVTDRIGTFRREALGVRSGDAPSYQLTARPYTWHEFNGLLNTVAALQDADVPRSQLHRIGRVLLDASVSGITSSVMEYLYTRTRLNRVYGDALLQHVEHNWRLDPAHGERLMLPPWLPMDATNDRWETIWPDLLEIYDMVKE